MDFAAVGVGRDVVAAEVEGDVVAAEQAGHADGGGGVLRDLDGGIGRASCRERVYDDV